MRPFALKLLFQKSRFAKNWEQAAGPVNGNIMAGHEPATEITPGALQ